jgi:pimeloyl-ACP methyl ester carboxylesterase
MQPIINLVLFLAFVAAGVGHTPAQTTSAQAQTGNQPATGPTPTTSIAGNWQGTLDAGAAQLRLVLKLTQADAGQYAATLDSLDQPGSNDMPLEHVVYADRILTFDFNNPAAPAHYVGVVTSDGTEFNGLWDQGGQHRPLNFKRTGAVSAFVVPPPALLTNPRLHVPLRACKFSGQEALCGQYEVFEDRAAAAGRKIKLNLVVLPALSAQRAPDPIFYFAGGPGAAATYYADADFMMQLHRTRDVVLVDQRGTGQSNPLRCAIYGDGSDMSSYFVEGMTLEKVRACRAELEQRASLKLYTTSIAMADLDDVRAALGYDRVNVYGGSYGSTAALAYLQLYPQHVRTVTLTGVAPLDLKLPLSFGKGMEHALEHIFNACAADPQCHAAFPDVRKDFVAVLEQLDKGPVTFDTLNPVTRQRQTITMSRAMFMEHLRVMLYQPNILPLMPLLIHQMAQQDYSYFAFLSSQVFHGIDEIIARGMQLSVICAEDMPFVTEEAIKRELTGTFYGDAHARLFTQVCTQWPRGDVPASFQAPFKSDVPVLLLSGEFDPVTPPEASNALLGGLSHGRQIIMRNATHNSYDCGERLARDFIERGTAQGLDTSCAEQIKREPFVISLPPLPIPPK